MICLFREIISLRVSRGVPTVSLSLFLNRAADESCWIKCKVLSLRPGIGPRGRRPLHHSRAAAPSAVRNVCVLVAADCADKCQRSTTSDKDVRYCVQRRFPDVMRLCYRIGAVALFFPVTLPRRQMKSRIAGATNQVRE